MKILFVLFMTDYFLTYIGIQRQIIEEANPILIWLFELPFLAGLTLRILMATIFIYLPIRMIKTGKIRPVLAKAYYAVAYSANAIILCVHFYWIVSYSWTV